MGRLRYPRLARREGKRSLRRRFAPAAIRAARRETLLSLYVFQNRTSPRCEQHRETLAMCGDDATTLHARLAALPPRRNRRSGRLPTHGSNWRRSRHSRPRSNVRVKTLPHAHLKMVEDVHHLRSVRRLGSGFRALPDPSTRFRGNFRSRSRRNCHPEDRVIIFAIFIATLASQNQRIESASIDDFEHAASWIRKRFAGVVELEDRDRDAP